MLRCAGPGWPGNVCRGHARCDDAPPFGAWPGAALLRCWRAGPSCQGSLPPANTGTQIGGKQLSCLACLLPAALWTRAPASPRWTTYGLARHVATLLQHAFFTTQSATPAFPAARNARGFLGVSDGGAGLLAGRAVGCRCDCRLATRGGCCRPVVQGTFLRRGHDAVIAGIEARIAKWTLMPVGNGEGLQVLVRRPPLCRKFRCGWADVGQTLNPNKEASNLAAPPGAPPHAAWKRCRRLAAARAAGSAGSGRVAAGLLAAGLKGQPAALLAAPGCPQICTPASLCQRANQVVS